MKLRTALISMLLAGALCAPLAAAAEVPNHPFLPQRTISGAQVETKPTTPPEPPLPPVSYEDLCGVAVNSVGDIFLSDYYHRKIEIWRAAGGHAEIEVGGDENGPCGLAVDSSDNVYVNFWHGPVIRYSIPYETPQVIFSGRATGIAIDPLTDDLYVDEGTSIARYASPVEPGEVGTRFGLGSLVEGFGVAFSYFPATEGDVYAADAATGTVKVYKASSPATPVREIDGAGTAQGGFVSLFDAALATDQNNGHLFVADDTQPGFEHPAAAIDEFTATGSYRGQLPHAIVHGEPVGIAVNESSSARRGEVYTTSGNGSSIVYPREHETGDEASVLYGFGPAGAGQALAVSTTGAGAGTVGSSPAGINCGPACEAEFNSGATVTLAATAAAGSVFSGWSGACSGAGTCQLAMTGAKAVSAEFSPAPPMVVAPGVAAAAAILGVASTPQPVGFRLGTPSVHGDVVTLPVTAPGAGTLVADGNRLRRAGARLAGGGVAKLRLHLDREGRAALAQNKAGRLGVQVTVTFAPSQAGTELTRVRKVVFGIGG
jgi:Divergent InlB B-repeat domain